MLKNSLMAVLALGAFTVANAQDVVVDSVVTKDVVADKSIVETNHFGDNWFIGANFGAQKLFGENNDKEFFDTKPSFVFDVNFGKWATPSVGVRFGLSGLDLNSSMSKAHTGNVNEGFEDGIRYLRGHGDIMFNLSNILLGYKADRLYSFIPYASVGYIGTFGKNPNLKECKVHPVADFDVNGTQSITAGLGLINRFHITDHFDVNLELNYTVVSDRFDAKHASEGALAARYDGLASATLGLAYNFNKWDFDQAANTTIRINENVLKDLRDRTGQLELINEDLRKQLEEALNREVNADNVCGMPLLVTFYIDRYKIRNKDRVNLGFLAEAIKANPNKVYKITGYADRGTGSVRRNIFLARKRAEVIYNCLVKEFGVSESQLIKESKGGVANMYYNDPRCSRAVLLQVNE